MQSKSIALVGARGYVGRQLLNILSRHSGFSLAWASSRAKNKQALSDDVMGLSGYYCLMQPDQIEANPADIYILALPNGLAKDWVLAIQTHQPSAIIIDLSADYRFDDAWAYGLPELNRAKIRHAQHISNPGCYATAMQLAIKPLQSFGVENIQCFGVSGYSGAGTKPSASNDVEQLKDNLKAYQLTDHIHEREVTYQLDQEVGFIPTVSGFFRGIQMTVSATLSQPMDQLNLQQHLGDYYADEPFVQTSVDIPEIRHIRDTPYCHIGGIKLNANQQRVVLVSVLDNLLKGAASQAIQNLNLVCGFPEYQGLYHD